MSPGDVALVILPSLDGSAPKLRPAVVLVSLPGGFGDWLVCGITSQLRHHRADRDEMVKVTDADYAASSLRQASLIRLGHLVTVPAAGVAGIIGRIDASRLARLRHRLAELLEPGLP